MYVYIYIYIYTAVYGVSYISYMSCILMLHGWDGMEYATFFATFEEHLC